MSDDTFFRHLTEQLASRGRLALATVVETKGSGPSRIGRRFLIFEDGRFAGTIGGGPFEALVVADAGALFRDGGAERLIKWYDFFDREIRSGEEREPTNMICGGSARVYVELLKAKPSLLILGGGHVGLALARTAIGLGYDVAVADDREEYARRERFPPEVAVFQTNRLYELPREALLPGTRPLRGDRDSLLGDGPGGPAPMAFRRGARREVRGIDRVGPKGARRFREARRRGSARGASPARPRPHRR